MEVCNNIRCVTVEDLEGVISYNTFKSLVQRGRVERVRRGCYDTPALYNADSFPQKYKAEIYRRFPDLAAQEEARPMLDKVVLDQAAVEFFVKHQVNESIGKGLSDEKRAEYANNASILNAFRDMLENSDGKHVRTSHPKIGRGEFWKRAAKALPRIADRWPNSLPQNARRLQEKYNLYIREGYASLISKKFNNSNSAKVNDEYKESVLAALIADGRNLDNAQIARVYNTVAGSMNPQWKKITASAVAARRKKYELVTDMTRKGVTAFRNTRSMQVARRRPSAAMLFWTFDGWLPELYYQKRTESGKTYANRLTLVVVLDTCCDYPIGYAIGEQENSVLITEALRNAVEHTAELFGCRYRACQIQSDNFAAEKMRPICEAAGDKFIPAQVRNAKAKVIEPYFLYLNKTYAQYFSNFSGFGATSRKECQPNAEWLNANRHNFPDEQELRGILANMMATERRLKHDEYMRMWEATPQERRLPMSDESWLLTFGCSTGYRNVLEGSGLRPTIGGRKMQYDCFDPAFRRHASVRWEVRYDPDDLSRALAVSEDGSLRFMLEEKYVQPMALAERKEGDAAQLKRVMDFNRALEQDVHEQLETMRRNNEALFAHNSQLDNTLGKHLIVDSRGRHKDQYNRRRLREGRGIIDAEEVPSGKPGEDNADADPVPVPRKKEDEGGGKRFSIY